MSKLQFTDILTEPLETTINSIEENMSDNVSPRVSKVLDIYQELLEVVAGMTVLIAKYDKGTIGEASLESKVLSLQSSHGDIFGLCEVLDREEDEEDEDEEYTGPTLYVEDDFDDSTSDAEGPAFDLHPTDEIVLPVDGTMSVFTPTSRKLAACE
jgi:hypothetical protein